MSTINPVQKERFLAWAVKAVPLLIRNSLMIDNDLYEMVKENVNRYSFREFVAERCRSIRVPYSKGKLYLQISKINEVRKSATLHVPLKRINSQVTHILLNLKDELEANYPEFEVSISPLLNSEKSWDISVKNMDVYTIQNTRKKR